MSEKSPNRPAHNACINLSQFYQIYFEEAAENLSLMVKILNDLRAQRADSQKLNAVFRCTESIKEGAITFGFSDVAALTHQMATLFDELRRRDLMPTMPMIEVLLEASVALRAQLESLQAADTTSVDITKLLSEIRALSSYKGFPSILFTARPQARTFGAAPSGAKANTRPREKPASGRPDASGPRSSLSQMDRLAHLVQELHTTRAMLTQGVQGLGHSDQQYLTNHLTSLEDNISDLQLVITALRHDPSFGHAQAYDTPTARPDALGNRSSSTNWPR